MERCPKCGNRVSHIDVLCPRCGALVEVIQVNKNFLPSTNSEHVLPRGNERPNLIVYNEDFPTEGLFSSTEHWAEGGTRHTDRTLRHVQPSGVSLAFQ